MATGETVDVSLEERSKTRRPEFLHGLLRLVGRALDKDPASSVTLANGEDDCTTARTSSGHFLKHGGYRLTADLELTVGFAPTRGQALVRFTEGIERLRDEASQVYGNLAGALIRFSEDLCLPDATEVLRMRARGGKELPVAAEAV